MKSQTNCGGIDEDLIGVYIEIVWNREELSTIERN